MRNCDRLRQIAAELGAVVGNVPRVDDELGVTLNRAARLLGEAVGLGAFAQDDYAPLRVALACAADAPGPERDLGVVRAAIRCLPLPTDARQIIPEWGGDPVVVPDPHNEIYQLWAIEQFGGAVGVEAERLALEEAAAATWPAVKNDFDRIAVRHDAQEQPSEKQDVVRRIAAVFAGKALEALFGTIAEIVEGGGTVDEKLWRIHKALPIPPSTSAETLGELSGATASAVKKTGWWKENRRGRRAVEQAEREGRLRARGKHFQRQQRPDSD